MMSSQKFLVPDAFGPERLDRVLAGQFPSHSRASLQRMVKAQRVTVAGESVRRPGTLVDPGTEIEIDFPAENVPVTATGETVGELDVLHEDEHLAVISKPAGLVAHPGGKYRTGTVADLAAARWGELPVAGGEYDRPGIVHRLDRLTSGVMLIAKSQEGLDGLAALFANREVKKTYVALVHGMPRFDSEWINAPIERVARKERLRVGPDGRESSTLVECVDRFHGFAHVRAYPKTGRTHQIRVHLEHMGHPIVGDRLYGPKGGLKVPLPAEAPPPVRQCLHAQAIGFVHPVTKEAMEFEVPLPNDVAELLAWLEANQR